MGIPGLHEKPRVSSLRCTPSGDVVAKIEAAMEVATKDAEFSDLVTNKLKFPVKFVGSEALAADIVTTAEGLQSVIEKTK